MPSSAFPVRPGGDAVSLLLLIVGYCLVGLAVAVAAAVATARSEHQDFGYQDGIAPIISAGVIGVFAGMVWPIIVPIVGLGLLARALSKEDP
jgi:hypothetical protein